MVEDKPKRVRRTAEEAKRLILDAAEAQMARTGPAGLRLQDLAAELGISHSTILHHFTNREGLVRALNKRTVDSLSRLLIEAFGGRGSASPGAVALVFAAFRGGLAQRIGWLIQADPDAHRHEGFPVFNQLADALHAARVAGAPPGKAIDRADSVNVARLVALAAFGDAFLAPLFQGQAFKASGQASFEAWLSGLLREHRVHR
jgi:AcrR family transcriptional regulator